MPEGCDCLAFRLCRFTKSNGVVEYRNQCARCGSIVKVIRHADVGSEMIAQGIRPGSTLPAWDESLRESWWQQRAERAQQQYSDQCKASDAEWWERYETHMKSSKWRATAAKVMKRAGGICEGCGIASPRHVHHLTYERFGDEMLFDLVALCPDCHQKLHPGKQIAYGLSIF